MIVKLCKVNGCFDNATDNGYCTRHQYLYVQAKAKRNADHKPFANAERPNKKLYNSAEWRAIKIDKDAQCSICGSVENLQKHHTQRPKGDRELFYDTSKLIIVCKICHDKLTAIENRKG